VQLGQYLFDRPLRGFSMKEIPEVMVDRVGAKLLARLKFQDEEVAAELVELTAVSVAEVNLYRAPVLFVQASLQFVRSSPVEFRLSKIICGSSCPPSSSCVRGRS
jgi:hypothetical protein